MFWSIKKYCKFYIAKSYIGYFYLGYVQNAMELRYAN